MFGVRCSVFGSPWLVLGVPCFAISVQYQVSRNQYFVFRVASFAFGPPCSVFGVPCLALGVSRFVIRIAYFVFHSIWGGQFRISYPVFRFVRRSAGAGLLLLFRISCLRASRCIGLAPKGTRLRSRGAS